MTALLHVDNISKRFGGFVALDGAFHGETLGATSLGGVEVFRASHVSPEPLNRIEQKSRAALQQLGDGRRQFVFTPRRERNARQFLENTVAKGI